MQIKASTIALLSMAVSSAAFAPQTFTRQSVSLQSTPVQSGIDINSELSYKAGAADTEFARRFGHLAGAQVKTVAESFAEFTAELGFTVNPLYKNMVTDLVGTLHLIVVNARFQKDAIWSLGLVTALNLLLKNYPEPGMNDRIVSALFKSLGLNEAEVRQEASALEDFLAGKTREEVETMLSEANPSNPIGAIAAAVKADEFWLYSRYFGIGLLKVMETVGVEMDKDEAYPFMEDWMENKLGRGSVAACNDSDMYFKVKDKLDMMETMMKEIEIREKKRMADRLEQKAEQALRAAEVDEEFNKAEEEFNDDDEEEDDE